MINWLNMDESIHIRMGLMRMNLRWDDLRLFLAVAEEGSLSGAARVLKLGQPTLSRRIGELEELIGEPLFTRQSQGASLTAAGQKLLPAAQHMAEWANEAALNISQQSHAPVGKVRIAAPPGIAYELLAPLAAKIRQQYPQLQIEVLSGIETLNLGRGDADISLRNTKPSDADLLCIDEVSSPIRVYCSQTYAQQLSKPLMLSNLDWICWAAPYDQLRINQELAALIPNFKAAFASDDWLVQVAACKAGVGAMFLPQALHRHSGLQELSALQELDLDLGPTAIGLLYLVCHKRHRYLPKVELVLGLISEEFSALRKGGD
jgi:DNA-binding transcriptional LysR family regulator